MTYLRIRVSIPPVTVDVPMFPTLFESTQVAAYSYGVLTASGFVLAIILAVSLAKKESIPAAKVEGLGLVILISSAVGSKLLTAVDYPGVYLGSGKQILWSGVFGRGGVYYGGFLFAVAGTAVYCRLVALPAWQIADCLAPGLALAQGLGRIGCFLAGCCWGTPTQLPFGVTFTSELAHNVTGVPLHVRLHPTQLYEAMAVLLSVPFLMKLRRIKTFRGEVVLAYVLYYVAARFLLEFVRGDLRGQYAGGLLSTSQLISVLMAPVVVALLLSRLKQSRLSPELCSLGRNVGVSRL